MSRIRVERGARAGWSVELADDEVLVGRAPGAGVRMDPEADRGVSARHALLVRSPEGWTVRDLGSRNGTRLNGEPLTSVALLRPGDRIELGDGGPRLVYEEGRPARSAPSHADPPRTVAAPRPKQGGGRVVGLTVAVAAVGALALAAVFTRRSAPGASTSEAERASPALPVPDTTAADPDSTARELEALRSRVAGLAEELRRSRDQADSLQAALDQAEERGADDGEVQELRRRLQSASAALLRQQAAATLDFADLEASTRAATAQVYVEFPGGRVIAATAFAVDSAGWLVTNRHVVRDSAGARPERIGVQLAGRSGVLPAQVLAVANLDDVALLQVRAPGALPVIRGFNERLDTIRSGAAVASFGFPLGGDAAALEGRGGTIAEPLVTAGILTDHGGELLEVQGYGARGASGSPLVDGRGHVLGMIVGGRIEGETQTLFAVRADRIREFLDRRRVGPGGRPREPGRRPRT